jgi:hypothetical protein
MRQATATKQLCAGTLTCFFKCCCCFRCGRRASVPVRGKHTPDYPHETLPGMRTVHSNPPDNRCCCSRCSGGAIECQSGGRTCAGEPPKDAAHPSVTRPGPPAALAARRPVPPRAANFRPLPDRDHAQRDAGARQGGCRPCKSGRPVHWWAHTSV